MQLIFTGKTKDVYRLENGNYLLQFKDDVTGQDGVFDPGSNTVGGKIEGVGKADLKLTKHFFEILTRHGIPNHYLDASIDEATMTVKPARVFGQGLEVICRYRAVGSFYRRYGAYVENGQPLDAFVEITLKDDAREDPPITEDALEILGLLSRVEYAALKELTRKIAGIVKDELAKKDIELYDIKFEFGKYGPAGEIILIDEISGGNMRAYKDGQPVKPLELAGLVVGD